jgi:hypothetical protein
MRVCQVADEHGTVQRRDQVGLARIARIVSETESTRHEQGCVKMTSPPMAMTRLQLLGGGLLVARYLLTLIDAPTVRARLGRLSALA